jgi:hypothetical protein
VGSLIDRLTRAAVRKGVRQGLLAGDGKWLAAGAVAWLVRFLMKKNEPGVVVERLKPGETIVVTNIGPQRGRKARRAKREGTAVRSPEPASVEASLAAAPGD